MSTADDMMSVHPAFCPVTERPFFMTIESEDGAPVATYGGPFDSYTIPEWSEEDKEFRSERFDHDAGHWVEGGEPYPFIRVDESEYVQLQSDAAKWNAAMREAVRFNVTDLDTAKGAILSLVQQLEVSADRCRKLQGQRDQARAAISKEKP